MGVKDLWNALLSWPPPKTRSATVTKSQRKVVSIPIVASGCESCSPLCSPKLRENTHYTQVPDVDTVYIDLTLLVSSAASVIHQSGWGNSLITGQLFGEAETHSILSKSYSSVKNLMQQGVVVVCVCDGQAPDIKVKRHLPEQHVTTKATQDSSTRACFMDIAENSASRCLQLLRGETSNDDVAVTTTHCQQPSHPHAQLPIPSPCVEDSLRNDVGTSLAQRLSGLTLADSSCSSSPSSSSSLLASSSSPRISRTSTNHCQPLHSHPLPSLSPLPPASSSSCGLCVARKKAYTLMDLCRILGQCLHAAGVPVVTPAIGEAEMVCSALARQHDTILQRQRTEQRQPSSSAADSCGDTYREVLENADSTGTGGNQRPTAEDDGASGVYVWSKDADVLPFGVPAFIRPDSKDDYTGTLTALRASFLRENVGFSQQDWVLFALYCGSDYCGGMSGYGKVKTIKRIYALHEAMKITCHLARTHHHLDNDGENEVRRVREDMEGQHDFLRACVELIDGSQYGTPTTKDVHSHTYGSTDGADYSPPSLFSWSGVRELIHKGSVAVLLAYWLWIERKGSSSTNPARVCREFSPDSALDSILQSFISELRKVYTLSAFMTIVSEYMYPIIALDQRCERHISSYWPYCASTVENNAIFTLNKLPQWCAASVVDAALAAFGDRCITLPSTPSIDDPRAMGNALQRSTSSGAGACGDGGDEGVVVKTPLWDLLLTTALRNYFTHPQHTLTLPFHHSSAGATAIGGFPPQSLACGGDKVDCLRVRKWLKYAAAQGQIFRASTTSAHILSSSPPPSPSSSTTIHARGPAQPSDIDVSQSDYTRGYWSISQPPESQPEAISRVFDIIAFTSRLGTVVSLPKEGMHMRGYSSSRQNDESPNPISDLKIPFNSTHNIAVVCGNAKGGISATPPSVPLRDMLGTLPNMLPSDATSTHISCVGSESRGEDSLSGAGYMYAIPLAIVDVATRKQHVLYSVAFAVGSVIVIIDMWHEVVRRRCRALYENVCTSMREWEEELESASIAKKSQKRTSKRASKIADGKISDPSQSSLATYMSRPATKHSAPTPKASAVVTPEALHLSTSTTTNSTTTHSATTHSVTTHSVTTHSTTHTSPEAAVTVETHPSPPYSSTPEFPLEGALSLIQRMRQRLARDHASPPASHTSTVAASAMARALTSAPTSTLPSTQACMTSATGTMSSCADTPLHVHANISVGISDSATEKVPEFVLESHCSKHSSGTAVDDGIKDEAVRGKKREVKIDATTNAADGRKTRGKKSAFSGKLPPGQKSIRDYIRVAPRTNTTVSPGREASTPASTCTRVSSSSPRSTSDSPIIISDSPLRPSPRSMTLTATLSDMSPVPIQAPSSVSFSTHTRTRDGDNGDVDGDVDGDVGGNLSDSFDIELSDGMFSDISEELIDVEALFTEANVFVDVSIDGEGGCTVQEEAVRIETGMGVNTVDDKGFVKSMLGGRHVDELEATCTNANGDSDRSNACDDNIADRIYNPDNNDDTYCHVNNVSNDGVNGDEEYTDGDADASYASVDGDDVTDDDDWYFGDDDLIGPEFNETSDPTTNVQIPGANACDADESEANASWVRVERDFMTTLTLLDKRQCMSRDAGIVCDAGKGTGRHRQVMDATEEDGELPVCAAISPFASEDVLLPDSMVQNLGGIFQKGVISPEYSETGLKNPLFSHFMSPSKTPDCSTGDKSPSGAPEIPHAKSNPEVDDSLCMSPASPLSPVLTVKLRAKTRTITHLSPSCVATLPSLSASPPSCADAPVVADAEPSCLPESIDAGRSREGDEKKRIPVDTRITHRDMTLAPDVPDSNVRASCESLVESPVAHDANSSTSTLPQTITKPRLYSLYRRNRHIVTPSVANTSMINNDVNNLSNTLGIETNARPVVSNRAENDISGAQLHMRLNSSITDTSSRPVGDAKSSEVTAQDMYQAKLHESREANPNSLHKCTTKRLPGNLYRRGHMRLSPDTT